MTIVVSEIAAWFAEYKISLSFNKCALRGMAMDTRIGSAAEQRVNKKNPVFIDLQSIFSSMMPAAKGQMRKKMQPGTSPQLKARQGIID